MPLGTRHPSITPFQAFSTADEPLVVAAGNDALWAALCDCLKRTDLVADSRFATNEDRTRNQEALETELSAAFATRSASDWLETLSAAGIPSAPIRSIEQVVADPHLESRQMWHMMSDGPNGSFLTAGSPFHMNGFPPPLSVTIPALDQHREEILSQWLGTDSS